MFVGIDNFFGGEDNFVVENIVVDKFFVGGEE